MAFASDATAPPSGYGVDLGGAVDIDDAVDMMKAEAGVPTAEPLASARMGSPQRRPGSPQQRRTRVQSDGSIGSYSSSSASTMSAKDIMKLANHVSKAKTAARAPWDVATLLDHAVMLLCAVAGASVTYYVNHELGVSSVMASSLVGVVAHSFPSPYRELIFTGSFAGMSGMRPSGPFNHIWSAPMGLLSGIFFLLAKPYFNGVGGKFGSIVFFSVSALAALTLTDSSGWRVASSFPGKLTALLAFEAVLAAALGAAVCAGWQRKSIPVGSPVLASAATGILASIVLGPLKSTDAFAYTVLCNFAYTGSFVGMSAAVRISYPYVVLSGVFSSLFLLAMYPLCPGVGGKFGFCAFLAVCLVEKVIKAYGQVHYGRLVECLRSLLTPSAREETTREGTVSSTERASVTTLERANSRRVERRSARIEASILHILSDAVLMQDASAPSAAPLLDLAVVPCWHDWVPQKARAAACRFVTGCGAKEAVSAEYGAERWADWAAAAEFTHDESLAAVLQAGCFLERSVEDWEPDLTGEPSFAARFAHELFRGLLVRAADSPWKPSSLDATAVAAGLAAPVLATLGALGVGLEGEAITEEDFVMCVQTRLQRVASVELFMQHVEAGAFV